MWLQVLNVLLLYFYIEHPFVVVFDPLPTYFHFLVKAHTRKTPRISSKLLSLFFFNVTMHPSHVLSRLSTLINCQATFSQEAYEVKKKPKNLAFSTTARRNNTICKAAAETHSSCKQIWFWHITQWSGYCWKSWFFKDIECQSKSAYRFPFFFQLFCSCISLHTYCRIHLTIYGRLQIFSSITLLEELEYTSKNAKWTILNFC